MRYIELDKAIKVACEFVGKLTHNQIDAVDMAVALEELPTEDVVPRAEVKQRYQIRADGTLEMIPTVESVRQEVAREIFDLIDNYIYIVKTTVSFDLDFLITSIAELKKKYIGE